MGGDRRKIRSLPESGGKSTPAPGYHQCRSDGPVGFHGVAWVADNHTKGELYVKSWKHLETSGRKALFGGLFVAATSLFLFAAVPPNTANAQSTSGRIFGQAPAGETVIAQSSTGLRRHVTVKDSGHYVITSLPPGTYAVTLEKDGTTVDTRKNIPLGASRGSEVDFACPQDKCDAS
ncbi:hypothetical protein ACVWWQ_000566 [Rhodanobacter sp. TND4EL1]